MKNLWLGTVGNTIADLLGVGVGGQALGMLGLGGAEAAEASSSLDIGSLVGSVAGGGVMAIVGVIKNAMNKG